MLRSNRKIRQIPANQVIADNNSANYLQPNDFSEFNQLYKIYRFPNTNKWIGFTPTDGETIKRVKKNNHNLWTGYKIHIAIPKNDDYKKHLSTVIEILSAYEFFFKIDADLNNETLGERAFTVSVSTP